MYDMVRSEQYRVHFATELCREAAREDRFNVPYMLYLGRWEENGRECSLGLTAESIAEIMRGVL